MRKALKRTPATLTLALVLAFGAPAQADCGLDISALASQLAAAKTKFQRSDEAAEASRAQVVTVYSRLDRAIAAVGKARVANDEPALARAMAELAQSKKQYDAAVAAERPLLIARIEADRALRGARQALTDAANQLREQGQALVRATERVRGGEVAPSMTDPLVCEQADCVKVSATEHAAMLALGAVPESVATTPASSPDLACAFALFKPASTATLVRNMRKAQSDTELQLKAAEAALVNARQKLAAAIPAWDKSIAEALEAYHSPIGNSHADELLGMAVEELRKQDAAFDTVTAPYRTADETVVRARTAARDANQALARHLEYWSDVGRAVTGAAAKAERDVAPTFSGVCSAAIPAQPGLWTFPLSRPPNC